MIRSMLEDSHALTWRKSSYSNQEGGNCVEVAEGLRVEALVPVRDSKRPHGPSLCFAPTSWAAFIGELKG